MKKTFKFAGIFLTVLALMATTAFASLSLDNSEITFGGDKQDRSNPDHDTSSKREQSVTETITIRNTGSENLTIIEGNRLIAGSELQASGVRLSEIGDGNITLDETARSTGIIPAGGSITARVTFKIPKGLHSVNASGDEKAWHVATIPFSAATANTTFTVNATIRMQAENKLEIKEALFKYGDSSQDVDDGEDLENIRPGTDFDLDVKIESKFDEKEDLDIDDIELTVDNDELDIDEDEDSGNLGPEDTETISVSFKIDDDEPRGTETLLIKVLGTDDSGARHGESWEVDLEVIRNNHDILIDDTTLSPTTIPCQGGSTTLNVKVSNIGRSDEDEVYVRAEVPTLPFAEESDELEIDKDEDKMVKFTIPVSGSLAEGNHKVTVETFYDRTRKSNEKTLLLKKAACTVQPPAAPPSQPPAQKVTETSEPEKEEPEEEVSEVVVIESTTVQETAAEPAEVRDDGKGTNRGFFQSSTVIILIVAAYVLVIGIGAVIAVKVLRK